MHYPTHDLGNFFWHKINLQRHSPYVHRNPSHEVEAPYRWSNSLILRLPGTSYGLVLGYWRATERTEEQMLMEAMQGRQMSDEEFTEAEKVHIRRNLIRKQISAEDQELLVEVLDL